MEADTLVHGQRVQGIAHPFDDRRHVHRLVIDVELAGFDLREVQHVVDDGHQRVSRFARGLHQFALFRVQPALLQHVNHADNAVHGRADLVTHRREESGLGAVGLFGQLTRLLQFQGAVAHPFFEPGVQLKQRLFAAAAIADVAYDGDEVREALAGRGHRCDVDLDGVLPAVLGGPHQLDVHRRETVDRVADARQLGRIRRGAVEQAGGPADHLLPCVAGQAHEGIVDEHDAPAVLQFGCRLGDDDDVVQLRHAGFEQVQLLTRRAGGGDVAEVHRQPVVRRVAVDAEPGLQRRVEGLEGDPRFTAHRTLVTAVEDRAHPLGVDVPQHTPEHGVARARPQALGLAVDVGEAPVAVDGEESVADAFERVAQPLRQLLRFQRRQLALGDVLQRALDAHDAALGVAHRFADGAHPKTASGGRYLLGFQVVRCAGRDAALDGCLDSGAVLGGEGGQALLHRGRIAGRFVVQAGNHVGPVQAPLNHVEGPAADLGAAARHVEHRLAVAQCLLGQPLVGDVAGDADDADHLAPGVAVGRTRRFEDAPAAHTGEPLLGGVHLARCEQRAVVLDDLRGLRGVVQVPVVAAQDLFDRATGEIGQGFVAEQIPTLQVLDADNVGRAVGHGLQQFRTAKGGLLGPQRGGHRRVPGCEQQVAASPVGHGVDFIRCQGLQLLLHIVQGLDERRDARLSAGVGVRGQHRHHRTLRGRLRARAGFAALPAEHRRRQ